VQDDEQHWDGLGFRVEVARSVEEAVVAEDAVSRKRPGNEMALGLGWT
jgi:hypothetical protein